MSPYKFLDSLVFLPVLLIMRIMQFGITNVVWLRHRRTGHKMFPNILQMFLNMIFKTGKLATFILICLMTFYCPECDANPNLLRRKTFSKLSNLTRHIRTVHNGVKHYCPHPGCSRNYTSKENRDYHTRTCDYNPHADTVGTGLNQQYFNADYGINFDHYDQITSAHNGYFRIFRYDNS